MTFAERLIRSVLLRTTFLMIVIGGLHCLPVAAQTLTEAQCKEFGQRLETDRDFYVKAYDWDVMLNRIFARAEPTDTGLDAARALLRKTIAEGVQGQVRSFESVKVLGVKKGTDERRLLIRTAVSGQPANHEELILAKGADGSVRIVDSFIYSGGENLSEQFRRVVLPFLLSTNKMLAQKLFSENPEIVNHVSAWDLVGKLNAQGKHAEALRQLAKLPESLQRERFILLQRLRAGKAANHAEYFATLDFWRRNYPIDPTLEAFSIDAFTMKKQYARAMEAVNDLDKFLGGDPYLDYRRAMLFTQMNNPVAAREAAWRAVNREPSLVDAGILAIGLLSKQNGFDECVSLLNKMELEGGVSRDYLSRTVESSARCQAFAASHAYRAWRGSTDELDRAGGMVIHRAGRPLKLQSIIYVPDRASATFNGNYVMVGEKIRGHRVVAIEERSVTLLLTSGETRTFGLGDVVDPGGASTSRSGGRPLKLQSIIYVPDHASATFNGNFVTVGEKIRGHRVVAIQEHSVTLQLSSGETKTFGLGDTVSVSPPSQAAK